MVAWFPSYGEKYIADAECNFSTESNVFTENFNVSVYYYVMSLHFYTVAARVLSKTGHKILRSPVTLQYASPSKDDHDASAKPESKLIIHELPKGVDLPVLEMLLERYMEMAANEDFTLEEEGTSVVVVFTDHKSPAGGNAQDLFSFFLF